MKLKLKKPKEKPITLEVILQNERLKRGWNYKHLAEQLALPNITAKNVKKWEYSFEYPDLKTIYRISELYQIPSEILVQAKNNGYAEGLHSVNKLFIKTIKDLSSATKIFKTVPVVVVITKSYSVLERSENIEMVQNAFANQKLVKNLKKIIPVVAKTYKLNDTAYAAPEGITELIDITNNLMPEGIRAAKRDIGKFKLSRKNALSQGLIASATLGGIAVGAIPIPFADAAILSPVEVGLVNGLASIYEIGKNEKSNNFINSIINVGTVSVVAKGALSAIKAIPGINIAVSALNAIIAGLFVATIGETSKYLFEQVYLGEKTVEDIDWATKILESKLTNEMVDKFNKVVSKLNGKYDKDSIGEAIKEMFTK